MFAFDKDAKRLSTLKHLVNKAGATCVHAECKDFLSVNPLDKMYRNVEYILVDPSCSGSGTVLVIGPLYHIVVVSIKCQIYKFSKTKRFFFIFRKYIPSCVILSISTLYKPVRNGII